MKIIGYENGKRIERELTEEEIAILQENELKVERDYWLNIDYSEAVNLKIRERYTESQEFAILRQKDDKPEEYNSYYTYCEECKAYVKVQKAQYNQN